MADPAIDSLPPRKWSRPAARWILPQSPLPAVGELREALKLERAVAEILVNRGLADISAAREFLTPHLSGLHDPLLMRDMETARDRVWTAIEHHEPILLYGDYDVDGTTSIVVLKKTIEILGGSADFHIPHRLKEGYGMRSEVVSKAAERGIKLIISVDTGIRASEVVRLAHSIGLDVIITDHHLPEAELPPALAVLNPNRPDCGYPNKNLCGAGVTLKLVQALLERSPLPERRKAALLDSFLKPVAIATVADIVPLTGENRVIVRRGLSGMREVRNPGLRSLLAVAGLEAGECPSAHQIAFRLAPRINAAGRMATARDVIELFLTDDADRARTLAEQLDALNRERQEVEAKIVEEIVAQCEEEGMAPLAPAMVFDGPGWHLGVLGIVASRLVERLSRPVFVLSDAEAQGEDGQRWLSGSGRSIPAFHLLEALEKMPELFSRFGGHRQAAGLTLTAASLTEFRARLAEHAAGLLSEEDLRPAYVADTEASFSELSDVCVSQLMALGPFGFGNTAPILFCSGAEVAGPPKALGSGKHLNVPLRHGGRMLFCKGWNFGERAEVLTPGAKLDVLYQVEDDLMSSKRGYGSWCVSLKDVRSVDAIAAD